MTPTATATATTIKPGTIVEVFQPGERMGQYAEAIEKPASMFWDGKDQTMVWVRYDNGCTAPVREYDVRELTGEQVIAKLNAARQAAAQ